MFSKARSQKRVPDHSRFREFFSPSTVPCSRATPSASWREGMFPEAENPRLSSWKFRAEAGTAKEPNKQVMHVNVRGVMIFISCPIAEIILGCQDTPREARRADRRVPYQASNAPGTEAVGRVGKNRVFITWGVSNAVVSPSAGSLILTLTLSGE